MPVATIDKLVQINPATLETIGEFEIDGEKEVQRTIERARTAFASWSRQPFEKRAEALSRVKNHIIEHADEIARDITRATGKPICEPYTSEIFPIVRLIDYFIKNGRAMLAPETIPLPVFDWTGRTSKIDYQPIGVVAIISPWNYPFSIPLGDAVLALLAGCTVVIKPSEAVPLVGETLRRCLNALNVPDIAHIVQGAGSTGAALINAKPSKIVFTGGSATGRKIMEAASRHIIPVVLELGGKEPMIVCSDANLATASDGAVWGCFTNSGQVCASVKRLYVLEDVAEPFIEMLVRKTKALRIGDPMDPGIEIGAMTTEAQISIVDRQLHEALAAGARALTGGGRLKDRPGYFFEPTILSNVDHSMKVMREEIFGPILPVMTVKSDEEAVRLANDSDFGLCASVWTRNISKGEALAARIEAGTVMVNECTYTHGLGETPWGGVKQSGFGRTHSKIGLHEFVTPHHINLNLKTKTRSIWWFPYGRRSFDMARAMIPAGFAPTLGARWRALRELLRNFSFSMFRPRT